MAKDGQWACDVFKTAGHDCCAKDTKAMMGLNEKQQSDLPLGFSVSSRTLIPWGGAVGERNFTFG